MERIGRETGKPIAPVTREAQPSRLAGDGVQRKESCGDVSIVLKHAHGVTDASTSR